MTAAKRRCTARHTDGVGRDGWGGARGGRDGGSAVIEFVFVAVILMVPLIYLLVAVSTIQDAQNAAAQAAREAGRAYATAGSSAEGLERARIAVRLAIRELSVRAPPVVTFVDSASSCGGHGQTPELLPGGQFAVCVGLRIDVAGVPRFAQGRGVEVIGRYVVHVDDYRAVS